MKEMEEKMTEEEKTNITSELAELKEAHSSKDVEKIKETMEKVNQSFQAVSMRLYQQAQEMASQTTNEGDVEVTDVDFEEVQSK
jgi:molecular chaperone DnaK